MIKNEIEAGFVKQEITYSCPHYDTVIGFSRDRGEIWLNLRVKAHKFIALVIYFK